MKTIAALLLVTMLLVACGDGGGNERILHMRGYDISEQDYRITTRAAIAGNLLAWGVACGQIDDLNDASALAYFRQLSQNASDGSTPTIPVAATPKPGQEPDDGAALRAVRIIKGECARVF